MPAALIADPGISSIENTARLLFSRHSSGFRLNASSVSPEPRRILSRRTPSPVEGKQVGGLWR